MLDPKNRGELAQREEWLTKYMRRGMLMRDR